MEREVIWTNTQVFLLWSVFRSAFYIDSAIGKSLLKIGTIHRKAMLFYLVCLVYVPIFVSFRGVKLFCKKLPAKPKCMFPCTALGKPLLKIGTMLTKGVLFHFIQLGCVPIFTPFGDFSPFRLQRVKCTNLFTRFQKKRLPTRGTHTVSRTNTMNMKCVDTCILLTSTKHHGESVDTGARSEIL
jgi:hypothetical protein